MSIRSSAVGALVLALGLGACGSDDGDGDGGGGNGSAATTACQSYCDATVGCTDFAYADAADCKMYECEGLSQAPDACATTFKNYYDCVLAKTDVCDETGCEPDFAACM